MKKIFNILAVALVMLSLASCGNVKNMIDYADQIKIDCNPEVLEVVAGKIDAAVSVTFPEDYFLPKAILEVTPVIVYQGGEVAGKPFVYQGEKVADNFKSVSQAGATIAESVHFDYVPGMEKSQLVARAKVTYKGKEYAYPNDIKIADGANTTYMLVCKDGSYEPMADNYMEVIPETAEAQILYLINNATVRNSELKSADVKEYQASLKELANDERRTVVGTEIVAYASPDGAVDLNDKLSSNREKSANKAFNQVTKKLDAGEVTSRSIGEDWDGFQELIKNSNVEDKDLILRVLSMYSDPNVREREIKNMSAVYTSLAKEVLPQLRRARFITNIEYKNYTNEELVALVEDNMDVLDEPALLRAANVVEEKGAKLAILDNAIKRFNSNTAAYNAACICLDYGENDKADAYLEKMSVKGAEYNNAKGVIALRNDDGFKAVEWFNKANNADANVNLATIEILNGKYQEAVKRLAGTGADNEALAYLLIGENDKALAAINCNCPKSAYKRAIVAARKGDVATYKAEIEKASKLEALKNRAENDIEFVKVR